MDATALLLALAMTAPAAARTYVALGDSTGVGVGARHGGYPARLTERATRDGYAPRLVNVCVSGARVADVLDRQLAQARAAAPNVVTVAIGINDVTHGTDLDDFTRDYERVAHAVDRTGAIVLLVNVPDLSRSPLAQGAETKRLLRERVQAFNERIADIAARHGFVLVDLFAATRDELAFHPELLSADRFHPSDAGYELWADAMQPAFEKALRDVGGEPSEPTASGPR